MMMKQWYHEMSMAALEAPRNRRGQMATLLLLLVVAILILALAVANLGRASTTATTVANAADAAGLYMGSQLATRSNTMCMSLGDGKACVTERCKPRGLLGTFLAILIAIIAVAIAVLTSGLGTVASVHLLGLSGQLALAALGGIAGAAGGALGGGIAGTGVLTGALHGAAIGAALGYGMGWGFAQAPATVGVEGSAVSLGAIGALEGVTVGISTTGALLGAGVAALTAASSLFTDSVRAQMGLAETAKALSGLPEPERIRESAFFQAFSQVIDDPNKTNGACYFPEHTVVNPPDPDDANLNGKTDDVISCFAFWWNRRVMALKGQANAVASDLAEIINRFVDGITDPMGGFQPGPLPVFLKSVIDYRGQPAIAGTPPIPAIIGPLFRKDVEGAGTTDPDGKLIELARALETAGYPVSFWDPGPDKSQLDRWKQEQAQCEQDCLDGKRNCNDPCGSGRPAGVDQADVVSDDLGEIKDELEQIRAMDPSGRVSERELWMKWLYNPDNRAGDDGKFLDMHARLGIIGDGDPQSSDPPFVGLRGWNTAMVEIRDTKLPASSLRYGGSVTITNPPSAINAARKTALSNSVSTVRQAVSTLQSEAEAYAEGEAASQCTSFGGVVPGSVVVNNITVGLDEQGVVDYSYTFSYECIGGTPGSGSNSDNKATGARGLEIGQAELADFQGGLDAFDAFLGTLQGDRLPFGTIDADDFDEFRDVIGENNGFLSDMDTFRNALVQLYNDLQNANVPLGGTNPATYSWADTRGTHHLTVETGPFKMAWVDKENRGNWLTGKTCLVLKDYCDGPGCPAKYNPATLNNTWVTITREDPANQATGVWTWNPFGGRVTKTARVMYNEKSVGISGTKR